MNTKKEVVKIVADLILFLAASKFADNMTKDAINSVTKLRIFDSRRNYKTLKNL